jgi:1-acyl-sn-glycerol-3-phosphate acyltransferase
MIVAIASIAWLAILFAPSRGSRHRIVRQMARIFLWLTGTKVNVTVEKTLPEDNCILTVNHSSYLDSLILVASISGELSFVAKEELAHQWVAGPFLRRLGTLFVRRQTADEGIEDTGMVTEAAKKGERIVVFPEATLTRRPGLLPFKIGAFQAAAQSGKPVVPLVLKGTRNILRGEQWFPRHGQVDVWVGRPIQAEGKNFRAVIILRDAVREVMLQRCGEPDLSG